MPIFKEQNILFIHIPKTGGFSVESALSDDAGKFGNGGISLRKLLGRSMERLAGYNSDQMLYGERQFVFTAQHLTINEMLRYGFIDRELFVGLNKFTVFRNPFDKFKSAFLSHNRFLKYRSVDHFINAWLFGNLTSHNEIAHRRLQTDYLLLDDAFSSDLQVLKFENLQVEFEIMCERFGITPRKLPKKNVSPINSDLVNFTQKQKTVIEKYYARDFEYFESRD